MGVEEIKKMMIYIERDWWMCRDLEMNAICKWPWKHGEE